MATTTAGTPILTIIATPVAAVTAAIPMLTAIATLTTPADHLHTTVGHMEALSIHFIPAKDASVQQKVTFEKQPWKIGGVVTIAILEKKGRLVMR